MIRRSQWVEPGTSTALRMLAISDRGIIDGRDNTLPSCLYGCKIAPFLRFDVPLPDQLYVVGGRNQAQDPLDIVEMFDTWHGRWVTCPSMTVRRAGCAAAVLPDGKFLVGGGYDERGIVTGVLATCEIFDPVRQFWDPHCASLGRARWGHGCVAIQGLIYAIGGCALRPGVAPGDDLMETLRSCEKYDPITDEWTPGAVLNVARAGARLVALGERHLAAVGGCDDVFGRAEMLASIELLDVDTANWALLDTQLSVPRTTAAAVALDNHRILIMGGAPSLASVEIFHMPRNSTRGGSSQELAAMKEGRMGCQAMVLKLPPVGGSYPLCTKECVVVVGGENGDEDWDYDQALVRQFSSVLVFDAEIGQWRPEDSLPPIPTPRTAMALCVAKGQISGHP